MQSCRTVKFLADKWAKNFLGQKWMFMVQYMIYGISHLLCKNELKIWNKAGVDFLRVKDGRKIFGLWFFHESIPYGLKNVIPTFLRIQFHHGMYVPRDKRNGGTKIPGIYNPGWTDQGRIIWGWNITAPIFPGGKILNHEN